MQIKTMKTIDRYAGQVLCSILRGWDLMTRRAHRVPPTGNAQLKNILLIKFWGMGSLILAAPVFKTLRRSHPLARIHLATLAQNEPITRMLGLADEVHPLKLEGSAKAVAMSIVEYFSHIRKLRPDAVIDLEYLTRFSAAVAYLSGAELRIGFHSWDVWRGNLHNKYVAFSPYWHVTNNFLNLHKALGVEVAPDFHVQLYLDERQQAEAQAVRTRFGLSPQERLIIVNPNASTMALERRWPEEYFIELMDRMMQEQLGRIAIIGAGDEVSFVSSLHKRLKHPQAALNLAGQLSLAELVGLIRTAALVVTNDSGPLHLADLLHIPTVSFFGPETPLLYGPRGQMHTVLYKGIECSPCINIYNAKTVRCLKGWPECLRLISVDEALAAVKQRLEERGA